MRTTTAATSSVACGEAFRQVYWDAQFRDSKGRLIEPPALPVGTRLADTHAHLDMLHHPQLALARAAAHDLGLVITVIDPTEDPAYTLDNLGVWQTEAVELVTQWEKNGLLSLLRTTKPVLPTVRAIIGCHPHNARRYDQGIEDAILRALTADNRVVGIGEIGLDYHYNNSPQDVQQRVFRRQIQLAHEYNMTIALHLREAHDDGLRILQEEGPPKAGILLHCFNLDFATLRPFLALGCLVAFGGPLTFKKSEEVRDAARRTPPGRIVTETDAPFMAPHPLRGTVCDPADVAFTAALLAQLVVEGRTEKHAEGYTEKHGAEEHATEPVLKPVDELNAVPAKEPTVSEGPTAHTQAVAAPFSPTEALEQFYANADAFFRS
ncbi:MAG: TatD family hydrolase [Coriobacteriales bacterium]|jgi:TatD DNase family protein|nr:TatD family hydrolase [Coriobacteriales bacterium]